MKNFNIIFLNFPSIQSSSAYLQAGCLCYIFFRVQRPRFFYFFCCKNGTYETSGTSETSRSLLKTQNIAALLLLLFSVLPSVFTNFPHSCISHYHTNFMDFSTSSTIFPLLTIFLITSISL